MNSQREHDFGILTAVADSVVESGQPEQSSVLEFESQYQRRVAAIPPDGIHDANSPHAKRQYDGSVSGSRAAVPDQRFGRYRIERPLGQGGMGTVYLAWDTQLNRNVALKTPKFGETSDPNLIRRFYREAQSAATLRHPNICPVYDVGQIDGIHYITMAFIDGRPLSSFIRVGQRPSITRVIDIVRKVAGALHEAHRQGVIHRDLKPSNIMIDHSGEPVVTDFGLAQQIGMSASEKSAVAIADVMPACSSDPQLTQDGFVVGSPGYMAPEHFQGSHVTIGPASDVFSLGVVLYQMLTGQLPVSGNGSPVSIAKALFLESPADPSQLRSDVSPELATVCQRAMGRKVRDRYGSMLEFAQALTDLMNAASDGQTTPDSTCGVLPAGSYEGLWQSGHRPDLAAGTTQASLDTAPVANVTTRRTAPPVRRRRKRNRYYGTVSVTFALTSLLALATLGLQEAPDDVNVAVVERPIEEAPINQAPTGQASIDQVSVAQVSIDKHLIAQVPPDPPQRTTAAPHQPRTIANPAGNRERLVRHSLPEQRSFASQQDATPPESPDRSKILSRPHEPRHPPIIPFQPSPVVYIPAQADVPFQHRPLRHETGTSHDRPPHHHHHGRHGHRPPRRR